MRFLSVLLFFNKNFMDRYFTTLGSTIYIPEKYWNDDDWHIVTILAHEMVHIRDYRRHPVLFSLAYVFPQFLAVFSVLSLWAIWFSNGWLLSLLALLFLAPWPAPGRAHFEMKGYTVNLAMEHWLFGKTSEASIVHAAEKFTGPNYYYMSGNSVDQELREALAEVIRRPFEPVLSYISQFVHHHHPE